MTLSTRARKLALTTHVVVSVGWMGTTAAFLGLAVIGLTASDDTMVRGSYLVMEPLARWVLLPLAIASLGTGIVSSVGTAWGLISHYWVVFKLLITVFAIAVLLMYLPTFDRWR